MLPSTPLLQFMGEKTPKATEELQPSLFQSGIKCYSSHEGVPVYRLQHARNYSAKATEHFDSRLELENLRSLPNAQRISRSAVAIHSSLDELLRNYGLLYLGIWLIE